LESSLTPMHSSESGSCIFLTDEHEQMPGELFTMTGSDGLSPLLSYIFTPICPLP
jgi:hypothetical protein